MNDIELHIFHFHSIAKPKQNYDSLNIQPILVLIHRITDKIFAHLPLKTQRPSPTNRELYCSRPD